MFILKELESLIAVACMHEKIHTSMHAHWELMLQMSWTYTCICKVEKETENDMENGHFTTAACMHDRMHTCVHAC